MDTFRSNSQDRRDNLQSSPWYLYRDNSHFLPTVSLNGNAPSPKG